MSLNINSFLVVLGFSLQTLLYLIAVQQLENYLLNMCVYIYVCVYGFDMEFDGRFLMDSNINIINYSYNTTIYKYSVLVLGSIKNNLIICAT